jgi:hypothetical protein
MWNYDPVAITVGDRTSRTQLPLLVARCYNAFARAVVAPDARSRNAASVGRPAAPPATTHSPYARFSLASLARRTARHRSNPRACTRWMNARHNRDPFA